MPIRRSKTEAYAIDFWQDYRANEPISLQVGIKTTWNLGNFVWLLTIRLNIPL